MAGDAAQVRRHGILLVALAVVLLSPDSLLVRLIDAEPATLLFWRGLLTGLAIGLLALARHGRGLPEVLRALGRPGLVAGLCFGGSTICFTLSVLTTLVAHTLIVLATTPLWAAAFSRAFLGERVTWRLWAAIAGALAGIAVTVAGSHDAAGSWTLRLGDGFALGAAFCAAGHWTALRAARAADASPAVALGGLLAALVSLPLADPASVAPQSALYLGLLGLLVVPGAFALLALGTRYLPSAEVAMMLLLETVLGTLWAWLVLAERPGPLTFLGGALVLATLGAYFADQQRRAG